MSGAPCPLLVLEAPEFLWDRDIFCVNNGERTSLLCAATAPQCAGLRPAHGPGSEPPTPSEAPRRIGDRFDDMVGDDGRERRRDEDGDGEHQHRHPGPSGSSEGGGTGAGESESALDRARARDLALARQKESAASGAGIDPATAGEDPAHAHARRVYRRVRGRVQGRGVLHRTGSTTPGRLPDADVRATRASSGARSTRGVPARIT